MDSPELIAAINRLASAHEKLADNVGRMADALTHTEGKVEALTFADAMVERLGQMGTAMELIHDRMPEPPEAD